DANDLPYSSVFLQSFEAKHTYRRFWEPMPFPRNDYKTLYACCGFGFTVITTPGAFIVEHFRNHYFQLGLLAHFHRASLLRFSKRFNDVMLLEPESHWDRLQDVRREFAEFISTSWFHEISNQEQGRELFELW